MDSQRAARVATFSVGIAVASYAAYQLGKLVQRKRHDAKNSTSCVELRPPFPDEVVQLLRSSVLCYLSTLADGAPHLSNEGYAYAKRMIDVMNRCYKVRSRRPAVLRCLHAIGATRDHQTRSWVAYFSILRPFGPRRATAMLRAGLLPGRQSDRGKGPEEPLQPRESR